MNGYSGPIRLLIVAVLIAALTAAATRTAAHHAARRTAAATSTTVAFPSLARPDYTPAMLRRSAPVVHHHRRAPSADTDGHTRAPAAHTPAGSVWDRLAGCESTHRWHLIDPPYSGGLQFTDSTWRSFGGGDYAPYAYQASRSEQITVAVRVQRAQGWGAWPVCSVNEGIA